MPTTTNSPPFDIATGKRQLLQLKELHAAGTLSNESYEEGRIKLERKILDLVMAGDEVNLTPVATNASVNIPHSAIVPSSKPSGQLIAKLVAAVVVIAATGYYWMGNSSQGDLEMMGGRSDVPSENSDGKGPGKPHATNFDQIAAMTDKLAQRLKDNPEDAEGWAMLGRSYNVLGRNPEALGAYEKALALRGNDAMLLADYADALALKNNRSLEGEPMKMIERALKNDPQNLKALSLAGTYAFQKKDYMGAVKHWEQVVKFGTPGNNLVEQVLPGLTEARELAGLPPIDRALTVIKPLAAVSGQTLSGTVTLSPALAGDAKPDDAVFIFARSVDGSRMPLALLQKKVKDFPIKFTLDDSMAMSPESTLSKAGKVTVSARVSKSGNAMPQKGDLTGQSSAVSADSKDVSVEIKDTVKQ
jgi:cytochrome c-type biogenesis protein CcmH